MHSNQKHVSKNICPARWFFPPLVHTVFTGQSQGSPSRAQGNNSSESNLHLHYFGDEDLTNESMCASHRSASIAVVVLSPKRFHRQCIRICGSHVFLGLPIFARPVFHVLTNGCPEGWQCNLLIATVVPSILRTTTIWRQYACVRLRKDVVPWGGAT